jgi:nitroreductase/NAD-dependent dihydropyrimidine dehydrogenase PreA subunit
MLDFVVSDERCIRCQECVKDCPAVIIKQAGTDLPVIAPEDEAKCIQCQHCLAVCPTGAISILGKDPNDSEALAPEQLPSLDAMELLVRGRRSIRRFHETPVSQEIIARLLATTEYAPTGANRRDLTFTVVADVEAMTRIRAEVIDQLRAALAAGTVPESMPFLHMAVPAFDKHGVDIIFRDAPHLLIVSAGAKAYCPSEDIPIALANFEMLAVAAGLGTVWCGMLQMALESVPELKELFGLGRDDHYYAMLFGTPAVRYMRTTQREESTTIRRISDAG